MPFTVCPGITVSGVLRWHSVYPNDIINNIITDFFCELPCVHPDHSVRLLHSAATGPVSPSPK